MKVVGNANVFLDWCQVMIDDFENMMLGAPQETQERIRVTLGELSQKVRAGEQVRALGQLSLEASVVHFRSGVIIPVM